VSGLVVLLANMSTNNQELISRNLLLVHFFKSLFSVLSILEANIAVVLKFLIFVSLNMHGVNFSVFLEKFPKLRIVGANW